MPSPRRPTIRSVGWSWARRRDCIFRCSRPPIGPITPLIALPTSHCLPSRRLKRSCDLSESVLCLCVSLSLTLSLTPTLVRLTDGNDNLPGLAQALVGKQKGDRFLFGVSPALYFAATDKELDSLWLKPADRSFPGNWLLVQVEIVKTKAAADKDKSNDKEKDKEREKEKEKERERTPKDRKKDTDEASGRDRSTSEDVTARMSRLGSAQSNQLASVLSGQGPNAGATPTRSTGRLSEETAADRVEKQRRERDRERNREYEYERECAQQSRQQMVLVSNPDEDDDEGEVASHVKRASARRAHQQLQREKERERSERDREQRDHRDRDFQDSSNLSNGFDFQHSSSSSSSSSSALVSPAFVSFMTQNQQSMMLLQQSMMQLHGKLDQVSMQVNNTNSALVQQQFSNMGSGSGNMGNANGNAMLMMSNPMAGTMNNTNNNSNNPMAMGGMMGNVNGFNNNNNNNGLMMMNGMNGMNSMMNPMMNSMMNPMMMMNGNNNNNNNNNNMMVLQQQNQQLQQSQQQLQQQLQSLQQQYDSTKQLLLQQEEQTMRHKQQQQLTEEKLTSAQVQLDTQAQDNLDCKRKLNFAEKELDLKLQDIRRVEKEHQERVADMDFAYVSLSKQTTDQLKILRDDNSELLDQVTTEKNKYKELLSQFMALTREKDELDRHWQLRMDEVLAQQEQQQQQESSSSSSSNNNDKLEYLQDELIRVCAERAALQESVLVVNQEKAQLQVSLDQALVASATTQSELITVQQQLQFLEEVQRQKDLAATDDETRFSSEEVGAMLQNVYTLSRGSFLTSAEADAMDDEAQRTHTVAATKVCLQRLRDVLKQISAEQL
jgi:hypothetical protein